MAQLKSDHKNAIDTLKFKHQEEIDNLDKTTAARIQKIKDDDARDKQQALKNQEEEFLAKIKQLKSEHEQMIQRLNQQHD